MKKGGAGRKKTAGLLAALIIFLAADAAVFLIAGMPRVESAVVQKQWEGLDLLCKYRENNDMAGWLQVDGTGINYPVMRGDAYLYRNFSGDYDASGSLFVAKDWSCWDRCVLIHGHNMWMYGTMFNPLHSFAEKEFFRRNRSIRFYAVEEEGVSVEKRTYEIICCVRVDIDEWNYAGCRYICDDEGLTAFADECMRRAVQRLESEDEAVYGKADLIVLSTCSYHVSGDSGRLLLVGRLARRTEQTRIDVDQR